MLVEVLRLLTISTFCIQIVVQLVPTKQLCLLKVMNQFSKLRELKCPYILCNNKEFVSLYHYSWRYGVVYIHKDVHQVILNFGHIWLFISTVILNILCFGYDNP